MKGLLVRLSGIDSEAEAALRVVEYFDALTMGGATAEALVRGAAALAECVAGLGRPGRRDLCFDAAGEPQTGQVARTSTLSLADGTAVWLSRAGGPGPLDEIIVERMAMAAHALLPRNGASGGLADVALVETVLSQKEGPEERVRALRRLGLTPSAPLAVLAVAAGQEGVDAAGLALSLLVDCRVARAGTIATVDRVAAVLVQGARLDGLRDRLESAVREWADRTRQEGSPASPVTVAVGRTVDPMEAHESWTSALLGLRFADPHHVDEAVVDVDRLGTRAVLAHVPIEVWQHDPHVRELKRIADTRGGEVDLDVLATFLRTGSLRQAALLLHMHHSTVASRLQRIEERLHLGFSDPDDVFRARLALAGYRLVRGQPSVRDQQP